MDNTPQNQQPSAQPSTQAQATTVSSPPDPSASTGTAIGRVAYWSLLAAIFVIPWWFIFGREMLGSTGWMTLILLISILPLLFILHIAMYVIAGFGPTKQTLTRHTTVVLIAYYVALFVYSIALVDGGDTVESVRSVLSLFLVPHEVSQLIADIAFWASGGLLVALLTLLIIDAVKGHQLRALAKQQA